MRFGPHMVAVLFALALHPQNLHAAGVEKTCRTPQSPRDVDPKTAPYDDRSAVSVATDLGWSTLTYTPRGGAKPETLYLCGQHYHVKPENRQGCPQGDLLELHHVYAAKLKEGPCDFYHLSCCAARPILVLAEQVRKVDPTKEKVTGPLWRNPEASAKAQRAEWSGSTTGPDTKPHECKPEAQWSFLLGCAGTIDPLTLGAMYGKGDQSRGLQPPNRLSKDLTLVTPPR
jgi:hypothetical protein